ncbi:ATP-binding protein [Catenuloplanes atrovinosus]|uniref:Tetratricopeptide (TPR) repeat protein n=1 Tax=Catenuloplanes atrovinosus TaxID=137266 RepID=A0AAE3YVE8_9ACTN|nr:NB-ARC domain-containing protein [Catenuloplanes atrovinosus]MDR7279099.1 tetratricopeptide (TPR) repeat protein [Catenuloplanes atrovinosus]
MRRDRVTVLQLVTSGLLTALLAIAINVATGGELPAPFDAVAWLAWPIVALLAVTLIVLSVWQHRLSTGTPAVHRRVPAQLPAARPIHGRDRELAEIRAARAGTPVIMIAGAPGAGKTTLALRAAHDLRRHYPDGQLYAELRGAGTVVTPDVVLPAFLRALGEPDTAAPLDEIANRFRTVVADLRLLIVLDDALEEDQIRPLLPGGPGSLVLVTSRRPLTGGHPVRLDGLTPDAARALLAATAGAARIAADPAGTDRIVAACAGLPLAVQLAAARLRDRPSWTPGDLADRLDDDRRRLGELAHGDAAVRTTFRGAYEELSSTDRLVFRRAGAHPGPEFGAGAAAAMAGLAETVVTESLDRLTDAMLAESPAPGRYRLHDLLRLYARELGDDDATLDRLLAWLTETAAPGGWRDRELENALAAVDAAVHTGRQEAAWALVEAVHPLLNRAGDHVYRLSLWQAALAVATEDERRLRALGWVAHSHRMIGDLNPSLAAASEAVEIATRLGDRWELAQAVRGLGETRRAMLHFQPAEDALLRALELFEEHGAVEEQTEVRSTLGTLYNVWQRPERAEAVLLPALALLPAEETSTHAWIRLGLSIARRIQDRRDEALRDAEEAAATARRLGDDYVLGYCHQEFGLAARDAGRYGDAEHEFRQMLRLLDGIQHRTGVAGAHRQLGILAHRRGRHRQALAEFTAALEIFDRLGDTARADQCRRERADVLAAPGR